MEVNTLKKILIALIVIPFIFLMNICYANENYVYVSGMSIGLKLNTNVEVLGTYGIESNGTLETPWMDKIYEHDIISKINGEKITCATDLTSKIEKSNGNKIDLEIIHKNEVKNVDIKPIKNKNNKYSIGLYVKDYDLGIGTLTFACDNLLFASLGHKMVEKEVNGGILYPSKVNQIIKPREGTPGEKKADIVEKKIGEIYANTDNGCYGRLNSSSILNDMEKLPLADVKEAHKGKAYILTTLLDNKITKYDIEITQALSQTYPQEKGLKIRITDEKLENESGGIIQGMSGSPIIQDGKLIGTLSHVSLKNPKEGYACYAKFMYDTLNNYA